MLITLAYEVALVLVPALRGYRLPIPYAVPIFDTPFVFVAIVVVAVRPILPSLVMRPGRLTPFAISAAAVTFGIVGVWALAGGRKRLLAEDSDLVAKFYVLAAFIWLLGLVGFLTRAIVKSCG